ncbi:MAG TPA: glycosyltransferase family 2 protein [Candidatus Saccharibacteria bacterium]|nr:glycosyltransferase family 2 protein [Candidatus Saccharibacteria bacterium]HRQ97727.1 glycosyltransferase family 2 protein [Candidatus Saccharibacteria bacterium]
MKLAVVSICKNEAKTIKELIGRIPKKIEGIDLIEVIVINDGSTDKTAEIAKNSGATVYGDSHSKGLAFRFREAINIVLNSDADIMVNIDGDLQFNPEDIPKFVTPIAKGEADFVAADRFTDPVTGKRRKPDNMPFVKYHGNKVGSWVVGKLSDEKFRDVTCGFRAYNRDALYALNINGTHTYTQESFQMLAARRMRIESLPVEVKYFKDRKSRVVTSIPKYMAVSMMNILRAFRDFAPLRFFGLVGLIPFLIGLACVVFMGVYWLIAGQLTPFKFVGFTGLYLITLGVFLWSLGLVADMQVRLLNNQEKTYEELRRLSHRKK